jgi:hypothetical protein
VGDVAPNLSLEIRIPRVQPVTVGDVLGQRAGKGITREPEFDLALDAECIGETKDVGALGPGVARDTRGLEIDGGASLEIYRDKG